MSVIYKHVEMLEGLRRQQQNTAVSPAYALHLHQQCQTLQAQIAKDIDPLKRLCAPWTYVPAKN